ncbi:MAG: zinc-ribbon domain-containing protein [Tuberibacillus sp.]
MKERIQLFCHHCGQKLIEGSLYCHHCGTKVHEIPETPTNESLSLATQTTDSPQNKSKGMPFVVIGWVLSGLIFAVFLYAAWVPILFGIGAVTMGILVFIYRDKTHGIVLIAVSITATILSVAVGHLVKIVMYQHFYY